MYHKQFTVKGPDGKRIKKKSRLWYFTYKNADGLWEEVRGYADKEATEQLKAKLKKEAALSDIGIIDKFKEHRMRPLAEHLSDFKAALLAGGTTAKHADMTYQRAKTVLDDSKIVLLADLQPSLILNAISRLQKEVTKKIPVTGQGRKKYERRKESISLSIQSKNFYLKALKQFFNWMITDQRIGENPIAHLKTQNADTDRKKKRRALTADELKALIESTRKGLEHHGLTGLERSMLYILAVNTGFRAEEIASLRWNSFDFAADCPSVTIEAGYSKRRRQDIQPLRPDIAQLFSDWKTRRGDDNTALVFVVKSYIRWADMLKDDLTEAGITPTDEAGRTVDFHALRHTFITNLVKGGVTPKVAQGLARHSKITLTMDVYTHLTLHDRKSALDVLPTVPGTGDNIESEKSILRKTGTDDSPVSNCKKLAKNSSPDRNCLSSIGHTDREETTAKVIPGDYHKSINTAVLGTKKEALSAIDTDRAFIEADGGRTRNLRIDSPML